MTIVLIANCIVLIIGSVSTNDELVNTLFFIDEIFLYLYIAEFALKIVGLGIEKYFEDGWNNFDFILLLVSLSSDFFN